MDPIQEPPQDQAAMPQEQAAPEQAAPEGSTAAKYAGATVVEEPPRGSTASKYAGYNVVDTREQYEGNLADATAQKITENAVAGAAKAAEERGTGERVIDWVADVGRSTIIGPLADPIAALILSKKFEDDGISYKQALEVVQANNEERDGWTSSLVGAFLGGGLIASGLKKGAQEATRRGIARGAMQYASKDKILNRVVTAAAVGGAAGAVEEGIRTGLEEAVDVTAGKGFDVGRVQDSILMGALIGGASTPVLQEGLSGAKWLFHHIKKASGNADAQTYTAMNRIIKEFSKDGETMDAATDRFRQKAQDFRTKHGRVASAAELLKPEQVKNIAEISRSYNGLDIRARELGEKGVRRALRDYDTQVTGGKVVPTKEAVAENIEDVFTDVVDRNGTTMVSVPDDTMVYLQRNENFLQNMANSDNEGALNMARIVRANRDIDTITRKYTDLTNMKASADGRTVVSDINRQLKELIAKESEPAPGVSRSPRNQLETLLDVTKAIEGNLAAVRTSTLKGRQLDEFRPQLARAMQLIEDHKQNGLKISLSDANQIRSTASRHFNSLTKNGDPAAADAARRLRDTVAPIGKAEVPEYGDVVKRFNLEMNRAEAMPTGNQAAMGDLAIDQLGARLRGRIPGKPRAKGADQVASIKQGAGEGMRATLAKEITGNTGGGKVIPQTGVASAQRVAGSENIQSALATAIKKNDAKGITRAAKQVVKTYDRMKEMSRPTSVSEMAEERATAVDVFTGGVFGNMGGAGRASFLVRVFNWLKIPRGTATKMVDMLGDPKQMDKALRFAQKKGVRVGPLFAAIQQGMVDPSNE
jgi:hypothetical protein